MCEDCSWEGCAEGGQRALGRARALGELVEHKVRVARVVRAQVEAERVQQRAPAVGVVDAARFGRANSRRWTLKTALPLVRDTEVLPDDLLDSAAQKKKSGRASGTCGGVRVTSASTLAASALALSWSSLHAPTTGT